MSGPRKRYLVAYDIRDDRRLRKVHNSMLGIGDPLQYSVFICDLSKVELHLAMDKLRDLIKKDEDSIVVAELGPLDERGRVRRGLRFLGVQPKLPGREALVI